MDCSIVRWRQRDPHVTHASFSPSESTTQTASRSLQPLLHSSWHSVIGEALSPKSCSFAQGIKGIWFLGPTQAYNPNGNSIGLAVFAQLTTVSSGMPFPLKLPLHIRDLDPHLIHAFLGPLESITQTTSRSVQPFLYSPQQSAIGDVGGALPLQNCPFSYGDLNPISHMVPWLHPTSHPKWHLDRSAVYAQLMTDSPCTLQWALPPKIGPSPQIAPS